MFDSKDIKWVDSEYFKVIRETEWDIEIRSRCTGHYWMLHCTDDPLPGSCEVFHRHHGWLPYHHQGRARSIHQAVRIIQQHDEFQLDGRKVSES